jgi:hypothetical protein
MEIHNGGVYKLNVTPRILKKYFRKFKTTPAKLNRAEARLVFLGVIKDYLNKKLKVDNLSYIATQIYYEIRKPSWFVAYDLELTKVLEDASEASWYNKKDKKELRQIKKRLEEYYKKQTQASECLK